MPKVHIPRKNISIDMTPMVDMAFLLVTFFMLTANLQADDVVKIENPKSISPIKVPDKDKTTITVSKDGRVFFNLDGQYYRKNLIEEMGKRYNINFSQDEINTFAVQGLMGLPISQIKGYLDTDVEQRKKIQQPGIPVDSANNELKYWLIFSRASNPSSIIIIRADDVAQYGVVKKVIKTLQDQEINRFSLITSEKSSPNKKPGTK